MSEVFLVDRNAFFGGAWPQGFAAIPAGVAARFLAAAAAAGRFVPRDDAERNPAWKQWIPYCVLRCGQPSWAAGGASRGVLVVQRSRGQGEHRLHGAVSIGLGGHIEPQDAGGGTGEPAEAGLFARALQRELAEELDLGELPLPAPELVGLLNDDSTEVGRVHAGLVYLLDLPLTWQQARQQLAIREISKMHGAFTPLAGLQNLWQHPAQFETWSQLLLRAGLVGREVADGIGGVREVVQWHQPLC